MMEMPEYQSSLDCQGFTNKIIRSGNTELKSDAKILLENSAKNGNTTEIVCFAQFKLAFLYYLGYSDLDTAKFWYKKAALQNHGPSQFMLGNFMLNLPGPKDNVPSAVYWLRKSASNNHKDAIEVLKMFEKNIKWIVLHVADH